MDPILGQLILFAGNFAPRGWALCDGQLLPIRQYTALYSILGTNYGGDGKVTFGLPDLRGRVVSHTDTTDSTQIELGTAYGTESNVLTIDQLPAHAHVATGIVAAAVSSSNDEDSESPINSFLRNTPGVSSYASTSNGQMGPLSTITGAMEATGGNSAGPNTAINNIQPTLVFSYCIALEGIFPQRP